jgi:hypothetical protein
VAIQDLAREPEVAVMELPENVQSHRKEMGADIPEARLPIVISTDQYWQLSTAMVPERFKEISAEIDMVVARMRERWLHYWFDGDDIAWMNLGVAQPPDFVEMINIDLESSGNDVDHVIMDESSQEG